ncbi:MAG TPA: ABC transporter permease [Vicinamibacterales bacterium]|jgi:putative ABC transport system permease protein
MSHEWRAALRSLIRRRGLSATIILTLALGIGANSAIFSAVDAVLLKPLPYPDAGRLVKVYELNKAQRGATQLVAPVRLAEWNEATVSFDGIAGSYFENLTDTTAAAPERIDAMNVSPRFFQVLGAAPALGRWPTDDEGRVGGPRAVVISDTVWRERFGADPAIVGRTWQLGSTSRTIVAVMPPSFRYPSATTKVWIPVQMSPGLASARQARFYTSIGRLKPGVSIEQARADLDAIQARLGERFPETDKGWGVEILTLADETVGGVRRSLWFLMGAVALVLVAACGNVACLMLADSTRRGHEVAVRFAIGASRGQVIRQLLMEGALLAGAGATLGLVIAYWAIGAFNTTPTGLPAVNDIRIDGRLVAMTLSLGVLSTLLFALAPALHATRRDPGEALSRGGRSYVGGRHVLQRALVAAQVGLAIVLLAGAGLLIRSFARLQATSPGFDASDVLTFRMTAQWSERPEAVAERHARTIERLEAIPGVLSAAFSQWLPADSDFPPTEFRIIGRDDRERTFGTLRTVSPNYFRTLRIPLLEGTICSAAASLPAVQKAVVSREFVNRFFPSGTPIGQSVTATGLPAGTAIEIVGIVGDVRERSVMKAPDPTIYFCGSSAYWPDPVYMIRSDPAKPVTATAVRAALREIEPTRAMYLVRPLSQVIARSISQPRLNMILLALFAGTALLLASLGLHGVLAQLVAARRREIGVRMALGAAPSRIVRSIAGQAALVTAIGIAAGLGAAFVLSRFMRTLVFDVSVHDPMTFGTVPLVLAAVAAFACLVPVRRASKVDPVDALRE